MAEYQHIRVDRTDDVVRITMDRAARRNSLSAEHLAELDWRSFRTSLREDAAADRSVVPASNAWRSAAATTWSMQAPP